MRVRIMRVSISIHALREEGDAGRLSGMRPGNISIHALREEGDASRMRVSLSFMYFYPRPPRGGRRCYCRTGKINRRISIHALREEGDRANSTLLSTLLNFYPRPPRGGRRLNRAGPVPCSYISIHALREEGDRSVPSQRMVAVVFLSTPSARRATGSDDPFGVVIFDFYPRPPRGGRRRPASCYRPGCHQISIHALREEGDI